MKTAYQQFRESFLRDPLPHPDTGPFGRMLDVFRERMSPEAFDCYCDPHDLQRDGWTLYVRSPIAVDALNKAAGEVLRRYGWTVEHSFALFEEIKTRPWSEASPAQRDAFVVRLRGLAASMRGAA